MKKKDRTVEVFSLSALDLFASAMGAFVLVSVIMLPYYYKGKELEAENGNLEQALQLAATQAAEAEQKRKEKADELEQIDTAEQVTSSTEQRKLLQRLKQNAALSAKIEDLEKQIDSERRKLAKKPKATKKPKKKVSFRFLGLKTNKSRYLVLVDGSARVKHFAKNLPQILRNTIAVFGSEVEFAFAFYRYGPNGPEYRRWPRTGFEQGGPEGRAKALKFVADEYNRMSGGSSTYDALLRAVKEPTESIILATDGFLFKKHNQGLGWQAIVQQVTAQNLTKKEINTVVIGDFFRDKSGTWAGFMNELRRRNAGDFKAIPP